MTQSLSWSTRGFLAIALLAWSLCSPACATPTPGEEHLINQLIGDVGQMRDVVFIRNGMEYSAHDAESHLRMKLDYFKADIRTAEDFIRLCATRSELTGSLYRVRDGTGRMHESAVFLKARLDQLRASSLH